MLKLSSSCSTNMTRTGLLIEIRRQCTLEEAEEFEEPKPEPDGFVVHWSWHHAVSGNWCKRVESRTRQEIIRTLASYWEDSGGPEEAFVLPECSDWFLQVGTLASPPALLGIGDAVDPHTVQEKLLPLWIVISLPFRIFLKPFMAINISFILVKIDCPEPPCPF